MQLNTREELQEDWVKFTRFHFKEGYIDRWIGYTFNNPNTFKQKGKCDSKHRFYRINGNVWEPDEHFNRKISLSLINNELRGLYTAREIYVRYLKGPEEKPLIVKRDSASNILEIKDIQSIVNNSFTTKDMVEKFNNLLTTKEIQVVDSIIEMLDSKCDGYSRIVRKLTEMRGDAVTRQNADFSQVNC